MEIKENQLFTIPYFETFDHIYNIKKNSSLILDDIEVYALKEEHIDRKVAFDIIVNPEEKYIIPRCKPEKYTSYLLKAKKIVNGTMVEIKSKDYIDVVNNNGDYCFVLTTDKNNQI